MTSVLIVEDESSLSRTYERFLESTFDIVECVSDGKAARLAVSSGGSPDCILLDLTLPDANGIDLLLEWRRENIQCAITIITANASINTAIEAMREGATDYLVKPFNADRLRTTVNNAVKRTRLEQVVDTYEKSVDRSSYSQLIGKSLSMQAVYNLIDAAAPSDASVVITGETGTGKELAARAVHDASKRSKGGIVVINCSAIPKDLFESELFGHVKGSFTGATGDRSGAAELADGGTLFLDELGEMPIELQPKLLRFVQTGEYSRVGESKVCRANIRFVAATNRDPQQAIRKGLLREDLFFRLNVIPVDLPALRHRGEDIVLLAGTFLKRFSKEEGKRFEAITPEAQSWLCAQEWRGNVRELENLIRRCVVLHDGDVLTVEMFPEVVREPMYGRRKDDRPHLPVPRQNPVVSGATPEAKLPTVEPLWVIEKNAIESVIALCGGNITEAAKRLDVSPSTIYRKRDQWRANTEEADT